MNTESLVSKTKCIIKLTAKVAPDPEIKEEEESSGPEDTQEWSNCQTWKSADRLDNNGSSRGDDDDEEEENSEGIADEDEEEEALPVVVPQKQKKASQRTSKKGIPLYAILHTIHLIKAVADKVSQNNDASDGDDDEVIPKISYMILDFLSRNRRKLRLDTSLSPHCWNYHPTHHGLMQRLVSR